MDGGLESGVERDGFVIALFGGPAPVIGGGSLDGQAEPQKGSVCRNRTRKLPDEQGTIQPAFFRPRPPALPAFLAISLRCSGVSFVKRAFPALLAISARSSVVRLFALNFASATAAGFFLLAICLDSNMRKKVF